jgi:hypothetical protein
MKLSGGFSGKTVLAAAFAVAAVVFAPARSAYADNFQYVFSGMADGTVDGTLYTNALFTLTFNENTSAINDHGNGIYSYDGVNAFLSAGQTFMLTNVTLVVNGNAGQQSVGFYDASGQNGLGLSMATPVGYNLGANLNVPVSNSGITSDFMGGTFTDTHNATLQFTNVESLGFTALDQPAPAPEPSSLLLLASGLPGLGLLRRRFLKA